jgi:hypothetical protein
MPKPTDEYIATLTENARDYIAELEAALAEREAEIRRLRAIISRCGICRDLMGLPLIAEQGRRSNV